MGDSVAPKIVLKDTGFDGTSSVSVDWEKIAPKESLAVEVTGNSALAATLAGRKVPGVELPGSGSAPTAPPVGVSPADFYFPAGKRNIAPAIELTYNEKISVTMGEVNPVVSGVAANSKDKESVAFWKAKSYKYSITDDSFDMAVGSDPISTELFEKYYRSAVRNKAPEISMRGPSFEGDPTAFLSVGQTYVDLNTSLATKINVEQSDDDASVKAAAVVAKYFGEQASSAPLIEINEAEQKVVFGMSPVVASDTEVEAVRSAVV